jgi:hypothetical protein
MCAKVVISLHIMKKPRFYLAFFIQKELPYVFTHAAIHYSLNLVTCLSAWIIEDFTIYTKL